MQKNLNKVTTTMNKTFTAAIAIAATAGLAMAAIETPPAGYEEKDAGGSQILVCNPFLSFGGESLTLGDIDGSAIENDSPYIAKVSTGGQLTKYYWHDNAWYTAQTGGDPANIVPLNRGDAIQFSGKSGKPLLLSGIIDDVLPSVEKTASVGYTVVGNAAPVTKPLSAFSITGNYDYNKDYVKYGVNKFIYKNSQWYYKDTGASAGTVQVAAGDGLFLYCAGGRRSGGALNAKITVPAQ